MIRIKNSCTNLRIEMCFVKYLLLFASFVDENLQNSIPRFWTTFLVHLLVFWSTSFFLFVLFFILQRYDEYFDFARKNGG